MSNKAKTSAPSSPKSDLFVSLENWIDSRKLYLLFLLMAITTVLAFWQFNPRLSFATDDAGYINRAYLFLTEGKFPTYQGPMYPIFLSLVVALKGVDLVSLKYASLFLIVLHIGLFAAAFYKKVPNVVLLLVLLTFSLNPYYLYYASHTFNEAFMMVMQAIVFWILMRSLPEMEENSSLKSTWKQWLIFGVMMLLLHQTKSISIVAFLAFTVYFLVKKKWLQAVYSVVFFGIITVLYRLLLQFGFGVILSSQTEVLKRKSFYDPAQGNEDMMGYLVRFYENFGNYVSVHFFKVLGLRGPHSFELIVEQPLTPAQPAIIFSLLFIAISVLALIILYKYNRVALIALLYAAAILMASFFGLQSLWNQDRLILPYLPFILLAFYTAFYYWVNNSKQSFLKPTLIILMLLVAVIQFPLSVKVAKTNAQIRSQYNRGNIQYGISPTIASFVQTCEWAGQNLVGKDLKIVTNKPEEAFVYGKGIKFSRINAKRQSADELLTILKEGGFTHLLLDRLGSNAGMAYQTIAQTYPDKFELVVQSGKDDYATYLFRIIY